MKNNDIYKDVEYFHVVKNGKTLCKIGDEINGKSKAWLQEKIGNELGDGSYRYSMKLKGTTRNKVGSIRAFSTDKIKEAIPDMNNSKLEKLESELSEMKDAINKAVSGNNLDVNTYLQMQKQMFETQIAFEKEKNKDLNARIDKLEREEKNESGSIDLTQLISLGQMFLKNKFGGTPASVNLADNASADASQIPQSVLQALNQIDFKKVDEKQISEVIPTLLGHAKNLGILKQNGE